MTFYKAAMSKMQHAFLDKNPCVGITTAFIIGIIISHYVCSHIAEQFLVCLLVISVCSVLLCSHFCVKLRLPLLFSWFIVAGFVCNEVHKANHIAQPQGQEVVARVMSAVEEKQKSYKMKVSIENQEKQCLALLYVRKDSLSSCIRQGDILMLENRFQQIENKENATFDYVSFLGNQYIFSQAFLSSEQWEKIGHEETIMSCAGRIREKSLSLLQNAGLEQENLQLIAALAFGDKSLLDEETKTEFQVAGAMHVLAVSGLHVGIINSVLLFLLSFIRKRKLLWLKMLGCVLGIWLYAFITGMSPSVQRASIMCTMVSISLLLRRQCSTYNSLASAAFISLLLRPLDVFSVSFQLSYVAVVSIVYFSQYVQKICHPETAIGMYIWGIIAVSISVQIGTLPLTLYYFGVIPSYSLITNIVVIPVSFVILVGTIFSLATAWIPLVSCFIVEIVNFVTNYLRDAVSDINTFPHPQISMQITIGQSVVWYCILILFVIVIEIRNVYVERKKWIGWEK